MPPPALIFSLVSLFVSHQFCLSFEELPFWHRSVNYFSLSTRNVSNNFHTSIFFSRVNSVDLFTVLVFWFCQVLKFFVREMTFKLQFEFCNIKTSRLCFLCKKTQEKVFLKALGACWYVQITVGFPSTSQKSMQVLWNFSIFTKLYTRQMNALA